MGVGKNNVTETEEKGGRHRPIPAALGRVTGAVEKGLETLTDHAAPVVHKVAGVMHKDGVEVERTTEDDPGAATMSRAALEPLAGSAPVAQRGCDPARSLHSAPGRSMDVDDAEGVVFHKTDKYKFAAVYWRPFSLPENGRMTLRGEALTFKGIVGTRLTFDLAKAAAEKTSWLGGQGFVIRAESEDASAEETEEFYFSTVLMHRKKALDKIRAAMEKAKTKLESPRGGVKEKTFLMSLDETLKKMKVIAQRKLRGVSLQDYFEVAWSEGQDCEKGAMYGPFLEKQAKNNVVVGPWESGEFRGDWCGEDYAQERTVTFNFMKVTIGQTLVEVKHTQRCRRVGNDRCIVQIKMEMKGFPYADCFVVEVRHVASRVGNNDISIQLGMTVTFLKSCMFENKIRTNTGAETTKAQLALLEMIVEGSLPYAKEVEDSADESEEESLESLSAVVPKHVARDPLKLPQVVLKLLRFTVLAIVTLFRTYLLPYIPPELVEPIPPSTVEEALQSTRSRVKSLKETSLKCVSEKQRQDVIKEIASIERSIERIEMLSTEPL